MVKNGNQFAASTNETKEAFVVDDFHIGELNVFARSDDYMKSKENKVTSRMMKVYSNTKGLLKDFEIFQGKKIDSIDFNFYDAFVDYLTNDHIHRRRKVKKDSRKNR